MATCKICGKVDPALPDWKNWECLLCFREELTGDISSKFKVYDDLIAEMRKTEKRINAEVIDRKMALETAKAAHEGR